MRLLLVGIALLLAGSAYFDGAVAAPTGPAGVNATPKRIPGLRFKAATRNHIVDDVGIPHILGEIINTSKRKVLLPQVEVTLFGQNNRVLQRIPAYTRCIFLLRPGDSAPVDVPYIERQQVARFTIAAKGIVTTMAPMRGVSFSDLEFSIVPGGPLFGFVQVGGAIRNRSRIDYYFPEVCVAGVNARGRFLVVGDVPTFTPQLPAGQVNYFQGQVGGYPAPAARGARFYLKVCRLEDVTNWGCNG